MALATLAIPGIASASPHQHRAGAHAGARGAEARAAVAQQPGPSGVSGTLTVTGAPKGFVPSFEGGGACPAPITTLCADPQYTLTSGGTYDLPLAPGNWDVAGFYELGAFGGVFLGSFVEVTVSAGETTTENLSIPYQKPAGVRGRVTVTGLPKGVSLEGVEALLCPSFAPWDGTSSPSIACVDIENLQPNSRSFKDQDLPPGSWLAYPGYCTEFGCEENADAVQSVTLVSGRVTTVDLSTPFILPGEGLVSGTVTVTGAPTGFSDPLGVAACQTNTDNCSFYPGEEGNAYDLLLPVGSWTLTGFYLVPPFDNAVYGGSTIVTVSGGADTTDNLVVPYQQPGAAAGRITVTGVPRGVPIEDYTVLACPASTGPTGLGLLACVSEISGKSGFSEGPPDVEAGDRVAGARSAASRRAAASLAAGQAAAGGKKDSFDLTTLTAGQWVVYPGYQTAYGSYVDPTGTTVDIGAGQTVHQNLAVAYQSPTNGLLTGSVTVIGAPGSGFESGVEACAAPPVAGSCDDEVAISTDANGHYELDLPAGNWWVSGFAFVFTDDDQQFVGPSREVMITASTRSKANLTVDVLGS